MTNIQDMLTIVSEDQANKLYVLKVKASTNDDGLTPDTVGVAYDESDYLMTGVLNGNEKFFRYSAGNITVVTNTDTEGKIICSLGSSFSTPDANTILCNAIREVITTAGYPL